MTNKKPKHVKCLVCGAVFEESITICPVCGVGPENFVPYEEEEKKFKKDTKERFLILGNGAAGVSAAEAIRERNATCSIVMVTKEDMLPYSRPMLTKSMLGSVKKQDLYIHNSDWYKEKNILNLTGMFAMNIDTRKKEVFFGDGIRLNYDKCIYALGAECFLPPIPGYDKNQVVAIRRFSDIEKINSLLTESENAVIIGGGVLGLEASWELKRAGLKVTVLEQASSLMKKQLDEPAGEMLKSIMKEKGIDVKLQTKIHEIEGGYCVTGVRLEDGTLLPAQLVILSAGVRSNIALAREAGANTGRAVIVNEHMETNIPDLYACGDCAEYKGVNDAIWPEALEMGRIAGANAAGEAIAYKNATASLSFHGMDTSLFAVGDTGGKQETVDEVRREEDEEQKVYKAYYYKAGKMVGAILLGDTSDMGSVLEKIE